ncbi:MAG: poly(3-hydroxybutyrate) depolymerase [Bermanella sp.]
MLKERRLSIALLFILTSTSALATQKEIQVSNALPDKILTPALASSTYSPPPLHATPINELPSLNAQPNKTSISGLSSGAFMASQFHVAYSKELVGAGIIAGGPWNCAASVPYNIWNPWSWFTPTVAVATTTCMNPGPMTPYPDSDYLITLAHKTVDSKGIDDLSHLKNDKVYLFSGKNDHTVVTGVVNSTEKFYLELGLRKEQINYNKTSNAGHAFITTDKRDTLCKKTKSPWINNCNIPQAQKILEHIYGQQNPAAKELTGDLFEFPQNDFFTEGAESLIGMNKTGIVYVPKNCYEEQCKVHVAVHGCGQGISEMDLTYIKETGYLEAADRNSTIVLYPQVKKTLLLPVNPKGCWDFWGYSTANIPPLNYYTKDAPQMIAIKNMIDQLISSPLNSLTKN